MHRPMQGPASPLSQTPIQPPANLGYPDYMILLLTKHPTPFRPGKTEMVPEILEQSRAHFRLQNDLLGSYQLQIKMKKLVIKTHQITYKRIYFYSLQVIYILSRIGGPFISIVFNWLNPSIFITIKCKIIVSLYNILAFLSIFSHCRNALLTTNCKTQAY